MRFKACCDCVPPKRKPGCHSKCPDYIQEVKLNEEIKRQKEIERASFIPNKRRRKK